ncbi:hypothetical protein SAMN05421848_0584 [Kushneria avicenniae]|uniref:Uncharacterized protein n=1 Tax=Kushneria avicenniae TaxID=402385 RepID=A0A1I1GP24_9GAMM|nr:DUF6482 family protein [Kushneria avicenniae]SFC11023.1 hypothetical protein SAMN05421848_0584 [Kushneria avicenniae]
MKLNELTEKAHAHKIDEIVIESTEGDIFTLNVTSEGDTDTLLNEDGTILTPQSLNAAKTLLRDIGGMENVPLYFKHSVTHDEMMGSSAESADDRMSITLEGQDR